MTIRSTSTVTFNKNNEPPALEIWPGIYCGGIRLGDSDGKTYVFEPGVYALVGGGLTVTSNARANGNGITFYNTMQNASTPSWGCPGTQNYSAMSLSGQGVLRFTAPTSGPFVGMLFFANRTATVNGNNEDQIVGVRRRAVFQTHAAEVCRQQHHQRIHRAGGGSY